VNVVRGGVNGVHPEPLLNPKGEPPLIPKEGEGQASPQGLRPGRGADPPEGIKVESQEAWEIFKALFGDRCMDTENLLVTDEAVEWKNLVFRVAGQCRNGQLELAEGISEAGDIRDSSEVKSRGAVFSSKFGKRWIKGKAKSTEDAA
jgi:hypothetical protein